MGGMEAPPPHEHPAATFSIVAYDPQTQQLGVAVQSKLIAVGAIVPWAKAKVGAVATQAWANTNYGPRGLGLLEQGHSPKEVIDRLTAGDPWAAHRQVALVTPGGGAAAYTGAECHEWAGAIVGENHAVAGNILASRDVLKAMAEAYENSEGVFGDRLIAALEAGQAAGGDRRGKQAAALRIVREGWGYGGDNDRYRDLRVDDHPTPIKELRRIYELHKRVFPPPDAQRDESENETSDD